MQQTTFALQQQYTHIVTLQPVWGTLKTYATQKQAKREKNAQLALNPNYVLRIVPVEV